MYISDKNKRIITGSLILVILLGLSFYRVWIPVAIYALIGIGLYVGLRIDRDFADQRPKWYFILGWLPSIFHWTIAAKFFK